MAEPTLAMTFQDMMIRVAEFIGVADYSGGAAAIPTDAHDLDLVKRVCNDGWRRFCNAQARWNWMEPLTTVTFDPTGLGAQCSAPPDPSRYFLSDGFMGQVIGFWTYDSTGPRVGIKTTDENHIRQLYAASGGVTGNPWLAATRVLASSVGAYANRWELMLYPTPATVYTISGRIRVYPNKLVNNTDRHNAGIQFDEAVLAGMMAEAEIQRGDGKPGIRGNAYTDIISRAIGMDRANAPKRLGYNADGSDGYRSMGRPSSYAQVDTYTPFGQAPINV